MNKNRKADLRGIGFELKTNNLTGGQSKAFSFVDYRSHLEPIQAILRRVASAKPKAIRFDWQRQKPGRIGR